MVNIRFADFNGFNYNWLTIFKTLSHGIFFGSSEALEKNSNNWKIILKIVMRHLQGWYTYKVHENCPIFKAHYHLCPSTSKILPLPWPRTSNFKWSPPLQIITNQLKENIIQGWLLYVIRSFFQVHFHFQHQLINLVLLSFDFFPFN